ncbi:hypothetical protein [Bradyrhizobium sp.]|uniref:hypothetical protein n=1 Tax=Bradyrhizobium sp. TaxID=376 RepID=UPI003BB04AB8
MKPKISLREALQDTNLLAMGDPSWLAWRALLLATMGEPLEPEELEHFRKLTGREESPTEQVSEFWGVVGRRGGKSKSIAALAVYIACLCEHTLSVGETGRVVIVAGDRNQAGIILKYVSGIIEHSPLLKQLVARQPAEEIELKNDVIIAVGTSNFRRVRGITGLAAIYDEIAFWHSEDSSNPDSEILTALRPTLATTGGPLIAISSPYARKGEMWAAYSRDYGPAGDPKVLVAQGATTDLNLSGLPALLDWIKRQYEKDPAAAAAEVGAQFRTDVETFVPLEIIAACTDPIAERMPAQHSYVGFVDPSGGASDAFTLGIAHQEGNIAVLDVVREVRPPFSPAEVTEEFASLLKAYNITTVRGDRFGGQWVVEQFNGHGMHYEPSELNKSEIYGELLPMLNSRTVALLDNERLLHQLNGLERRRGRTGRDIIDHPKGGHDDLINAAAGALVLAQEGFATPPDFNRVIEYPKLGVA